MNLELDLIIMNNYGMIKENLPNNLKKNYLINSFFIALFFVSLRIGEVPHRIPTFIFFILVSLYYFVTSKISRLIINKIIYVSLILILHFLFCLFFQNNDNIKDPLFLKLSWFLQYLFLLILIIWMGLQLDHEILLISYLKIGKISIYFLYLLLFLTLVLNTSLGADVWSNGWIRPHGFFSEPSNLVYVLPGFLMYGIINKRKIFTFIIIFSILLTLSPTVYGVTIITLLLFYYSRASKYKKLIFIAIFLTVLFLFILFGYYIYQSFDSSNALSFSIQRLIGGILKITNNDDSLSNSRADLAIGWFDFIKLNPFAFVFGFGLGVSNAYTPYYNNGMTFDSSIIIMLINSFGFVIMCLILIFILYAIYISKENKSFQWIFISVFIGQIFNPSGVYYQYFIILLSIVSLNSFYKIKYEK
jgi:hypothetical protein